MANHNEHISPLLRVPCAYHYTLGTRTICEIEVNNLKIIFLVSTVAIFIIMSLHGYLNGIYAGNSLALKIGTPILLVLGFLPCIFSYIGLADIYKIAPKELYNIFT